MRLVFTVNAGVYAECDDTGIGIDIIHTGKRNGFSDMPSGYV